MKPIKGRVYHICYAGGYDYNSFHGEAVCTNDQPTDDGWYAFGTPQDPMFFDEENIICER